MSNNFIAMIDSGKNCFGQFNPDGTINAYRIENTTIPYGNPYFDEIKKYLDEKKLNPICPLEWIEEIRGNENELLHYNTNIGRFTESLDNYVTSKIKSMIEQKEIILKESDEYINVESLEINVFLPRAFQLHGEGYPKPLSSYCFEDGYLSLPFHIKVEILQGIEENFFEKNEYFLDSLRNINGNVLRYTIDKSKIVKIYNWSKKYLTNELEYLNQSLNYDYALQKRKKSKGPRTQWCFDYLNLQNYIWIPILYITNKLIYLINSQAREKTIGLLSRHELGNMICMKVLYDNGQDSIMNLSNIQDQQIAIFPSQLKWKHKPLELPLQRIRFLFNQGLYFESIIVTQALCESLVYGMFPTQDSNLKWEEAYKYLSIFFNEKLRNDSKLKELLNGGLYRMYKYRNDFAHDYLVHTPDYAFEFEHFNEIKQLLEPFIDLHTNIHFLWDVDTMYKERNKFIIYYLEKEKKQFINSFTDDN